METNAVEPVTRLDEAKGFERLFLSEAGVGREALCRQLGVEPQVMGDRLELLRAPVVVQDAIAARLVSAPEALAISRLPDARSMESWIHALSNGDVSMRDLMSYLAGETVRRASDRRPPVADPLEELEDAVHTPVA